MPNEERYKPGSVELERLSLTNFDGSKTENIKGFATEINIYEDIFQCQIFGDISIKDTSELIEFFPIIGEETLELKFRVVGRENKDSIDFKKMRIYKIGDRSATGKDLGKVQTYKLYFFSPELITNLNSRVSRSFNMRTASDIAKSVLDEYIKSDKSFDIEETEGTLKAVIPSWNPFRTISWLACNRAINIHKQSDFLFFESSDKNNGPKYNFKSLSTLMNQETTFDMEFKIQNMLKDGKEDISTSHKTIEDFNFDSHGSVLDNTMKGQYNQTWIYHDPLRKSFRISKPNHKEDYLDTNSETNIDAKTNKKFYGQKVEGESLPMQFVRMPGGVDAFPSNISSSKSMDNDKTKSTESRPMRKDIKYIAKREKNDELETTSLVVDHAHMRTFKIQQMNNFKLIISSIPGTDEIQLGKMVNFKKPHITHDSDQVSNKTGRFDDRFVSGKYLVTRLRHRIYFKEGKPERVYEQSIELVKDSFNETISHKNISGDK